ncbi:cytochrome P450 [Streptomyces virginiae]|uniref:cytochrome P450 n=1 Tax=Streptomyces virginiae TaxID=1961 RepID=UPI0036875C76
MNRPPGPPGTRLAGNGPAYDKDRLGFMTEMSQRYGGIWSFDRHIVVIADPALAGEVLLRTNKDFGGEVDFLHQKQKEDDATMQQWASSRAARMRGMRPSAMQDRIPLIAAEMGREIPKWMTAGNVDVVDRMRALTSWLGSLICFGPDASLAHGLEQDLFDALLPVIRSTIVWPSWMPLPRHRRVVRANRALENGISQVITARRSQDRTDAADLLGVLMKPTGRHGELSDRILRETLAATLLAAQSAPSSGFGWTIHELVNHPHIQQRVAAEAAAVLPSTGPITSDHYTRLEYTARVVKEAMRLWPPNWVYARHALHDTELGGYTLPRDTKVMVPSYVIQRDAQWFPDPLVFDPDRWLPEGSGTKAVPHAYLPFGAGPLVCMGLSWSLIEMTLGVALLMRDFTVERAPGTNVVPDPARELTPAGLMVRLSERQRPTHSSPDEPLRRIPAPNSGCPMAAGVPV